MFTNDVAWEPAIQTITALAVLLVSLVKPVVDAIKLAFPKLPSAAFPALAVCIGIVMMLLLAVSTSTALTLPLIAQMVLASLLSAVSAGGINRLHDKANDAIEQKRKAAEQATVAEQKRKAAEQAAVAEQKREAAEQAAAAEQKREADFLNGFSQRLMPIIDKAVEQAFMPHNGGTSQSGLKKP